jgi:tRNA(His) 5'-end guanylyltransferase
MSFLDRLEKYKSASNSFLMPKLPVVIELELRNHKRLFKNLAKPFDENLYSVLALAGLNFSTELHGFVFGFYSNNKYFFVLRNDLTNDSVPWLNNNIQEIVSISSSILTDKIYGAQKILNLPLNFKGDLTVKASTWSAPNLAEIIQFITHGQVEAWKESVQEAAFFHCSEVFDRKKAFKLLYQKPVEEKLKILKESCNIDFHSFYDQKFQTGTGYYKIPIMDPISNTMRSKIHLDSFLPNLYYQKDFIYGILNNGIDIFRTER